MLNISQGKYEDTVKECTKALELNPAYVKALVRRGEAHEKLEHFEEAIAGKFKFYIRGYYTKLPLLCISHLTFLLFGKLHRHPLLLCCSYGCPSLFEKLHFPLYFK